MRKKRKRREKAKKRKEKKRRKELVKCDTGLLRKRVITYRYVDFSKKKKRKKKTEMTGKRMGGGEITMLGLSMLVFFLRAEDDK